MEKEISAPKPPETGCAGECCASASKGKWMPIFGWIVVMSFAVLGLSGSILVALGYYGSEEGENLETDGRLMSFAGDDCNIAVIPVLGEILPYAGADKGGDAYELPPSTNPLDVLYAMRTAENDENIKGVLAYIDSYGGSAVAGEDIMKLFSRSPLPSAALIRGIGASAAYEIATGADIIIASPSSDVGSIGITMSYLDYSEQNEKEGIKYVALSSGKFKDAGSEYRPLTDEERGIFERDIMTAHDYFVKTVAENRKLPIEAISKIADGSSMSGVLALQHKLIDALGDRETARGWFAEKLEMPSEEIVFCDE